MHSCGLSLATTCPPQGAILRHKTAFIEQFGGLGSHGTRVVIFNLWENDDGLLELDFETDPRDILLRSRDVDTEKADAFPDSHVYFTYMHSLRVRSRLSAFFVRSLLWIAKFVVKLHSMPDD